MAIKYYIYSYQTIKSSSKAKYSIKVYKYTIFALTIENKL